MKLYLTLKDLLKATGGRLVRGTLSNQALYLETDTRRLQPGGFFVPLKGTRFDGHEFLSKTKELHAAGAFFQKGRIPPHDFDDLPPILIEVPDPLTAYQQVAAFLRKKWGGTVIAITGSSGKTSVKEMIASILSQSLKVLKTEINENNEIGVPKTLLRLCEEHQVAIIEMGMRGKGQIRALVEVASPDIALVTNVGLAHVEKLGSPEGIMEAKREIFSLLPRQGKALLPKDSPWFDALSKGLYPDQIISFGLAEGSLVYAQNIEVTNQGLRFFLCIKEEKIYITMPLLGQHHLQNALAAAGAAYAFGIALEEIKRGLENYKPLEGRGARIQLHRHITLIDDSYNANPDSMKAGLEAFTLLPGRKTVLLGDMLELGSYAEEAHRAIGELAGRLGFDKILTVGNFRKEIIRGVYQTSFPKDRVFAFGSNVEVTEYLLRNLEEGDLLFIKASHGQHLDEVARELMLRLT